MATKVSTTTVTTPSSAISAFLSLIAQPLGGLLAFGLGVAGLAYTGLHMTQQLSIALIIAGLAVFHVTVSNSAS